MGIMKKFMSVVAGVVFLVAVHIASGQFNCGQAFNNKKRSDYNFLTNQCSGNPEQSGYLDRLHKGSRATLTTEDIGVMRDGSKVCVGKDGETFRVLLVIPVPRSGLPIVGTFAITNQGDKSFNNND